jgi:hypothetical protein
MNGLISRWLRSSTPARKPRRVPLGVELLEDRVTPTANLLVSTSVSYPQQRFMEFTSSGQLVRSVTIPPGGPQQEAHDLIADPTGDVLVFNGTANPYLSTRDADTGAWSQRTLPGWSTSGLSSGGIALAGNRVFATDLMTSGAGTAKGIVWFDRVTGASGRFATNFNPIDLTVGKDGKLYALDSFGAIQVFNTQSLALQRTLTLPGTIGGATQWYAGIAVNTNGDIFAATSSNKIVHRFNTNGVLQNSVSVPGPGGFFGWLTDIDLSDDGQLAVGTTSGHIVRMTTGLTNVTYQTVSNTTTFVAFAAPIGPPSVSIGDATVNEGASGVTTATFTLTLTAPRSQPTYVDYALQNGTAIAGSDFVADGGTLVFNPGETSKTISVDVLGDTQIEADETFFVNLLGANVPIIDGQGIGTIRNDDVLSLSVSDATVDEGNSGSVYVTFTVTLNAPSSQTVKVDYATADLTVVAGLDYEATSGTLTFNPGETSKTVSVTTFGDLIDENGEIYYLNLSNALNASIADGNGVGIIWDDDAATLSIGDMSIVEGNSGSAFAAFIISLSTVSSFPVQVSWYTADGTATAGSDYTASSGTVNFAAGETSKTVLVPILGDAVLEADETFVVNLGTAYYATIVDGKAVATILNDDALPVLSVNDTSVIEGDSGTVQAVFTLSLSQASTEAVTANYGISGNGAGSGVDYEAATPGAVTFAPGETSKTVTVTVLSDTLDETDEGFILEISDATNATIGDGLGVGTIIDDDTAVLSINDVSVTEGNSGTADANFTVSLLSASTQTVTVDWATVSGTAVAGSDFVVGSGTLTFAPGETTTTISVAVLGDSANEATETFRVELASPTNAVLQDALGIGTIINDDTPPTVSILDTTATEGDSGSVNATFTVLLSSASGSTVTVEWRTWAVYTAAVSSDFADSQGTVTFAPGETSQTVTVPILADAVDESDETFMIVMSNAVGATFADSQALGTILDNDPTAPRTSLGAVSSGYAADNDGNGTFDQFLTTDSNGQLPVYNSDTFAPERRAILEFNVSSVNAAAVGSVTFDFRQTSYTFGPGYSTGSVEIYGYAGNGSASLADATSAGAVFLGVYDPKDDTGPHSVTLDRTAMLSLVGAGNYVGLRLVGISNAESTFYAPTGYTPPALVFHTHALPPAVTISIGDVSVVEGDPDGGNSYTDLIFTLTLSGANTVPVAVTWQTADGTALAGSDYVASRGVVVFNPGETVKTITIRVFKDAAHEADETFGVRLQNLSNATIAYGNALASILNDDPLL